jgi:hypothetical protein
MGRKRPGFAFFACKPPNASGAVRETDAKLRSFGVVFVADLKTGASECKTRRGIEYPETRIRLSRLGRLKQGFSRFIASR